MVLEDTVTKRNLTAIDVVFNLDKFYKDVKKKADALGYDFVEKEQGNKPGKYGQEIKFDFVFNKDFDYFANFVILITLNFDHLHKVKGGDKGDCKAKIKSVLTLDYKNRWGMSKFNKTLLKIYAKIKKPYIDDTYVDPLFNDTNEIMNMIKEHFGY